MNPLAKARRRIKQLEKCLDAVAKIARMRAYDLNGHGADTPDNPEYRTLNEINNRINRSR